MRDKDRKVSLANPTLKQLEKFKMFELRQGNGQTIEPEKEMTAKKNNGNPIYHMVPNTGSGLTPKKRSPLQSPKTTTERTHDEFYSQLINADVQKHQKEKQMKKIEDRRYQKVYIE